MAMRGRPKAAVVLEAGEKAELEHWARGKLLNDELEDVFRRWYPQLRLQAA